MGWRIILKPRVVSWIEADPSVGLGDRTMGSEKAMSDKASVSDLASVWSQGERRGERISDVQEMMRRREGGSCEASQTMHSLSESQRELRNLVREQSAGQRTVVPKYGYYDDGSDGVNQKRESQGADLGAGLPRAADECWCHQSDG